MVENTNTQKEKCSPALVFLCIALIWFVTTMLTRNAPEWDNMEELVWASSFEWGYQKHPPLPSWIMYPLTTLFGKEMWLAFALGFFNIFLAQCIVYQIFKKICSANKALIPSYAPLVLTLTGSLIIYYTTRGGDYNHNSVQLWSIAGMFYFYYATWIQERESAQCLINRSTYYFNWMLLGLVTGLAILSKYSVIVQIIVLFSHFIVAKRYQNRLAIIGGLISAFIALLFISPHVIWLYQQTIIGQGPIYYARVSLGESSTYLTKLIELFFGFFVTQFFRVLPIIVSLFLIIRVSKKEKSGDPTRFPRVGSATTWWKKFSTQDRLFLFFFAFGPTIVAMLIGIVFGQKIEAKWAVTFYLGLGMLGAFYADELDVKRFIKNLLLIHLLFAFGYAMIIGPVTDYLGKQGRGNFPSEKLAKAIHQQWQANGAYTKGENITWVAGDTWIIGNVIIHDPVSKGRKIKAWIDADDLQSPWLTAEDKKKPLLLLMDYSPTVAGKWWRGGHPASPKVKEMFEQAPVKGIVSIPWTSNKDAPPLQVEWAILPNVEEK